MKFTADLLIVHAGQLLTLAGPNEVPRTGSAMDDLGLITDGAVAVSEGVIVAAGPTADVMDSVIPAPGCTILDAAGRVVLPGLVDPHTHLVYAGSRADEFERRLQGASYQEIARAGGGILATMRATREATESGLVALGMRRLDRMLAHGTTTVEAKSGYGLTVDDELKCLRVINRLTAVHEVDVIPTFLGAHAVPPEYAGNPAGYVDLIIDEMLPAVIDEDLAEFCDVFCEAGAFSPQQSRDVLTAAREAGLDAKIHADELSDLGGAALAADVEAISADHLLMASDDGLRAMAAVGTMAVLLPGTAFFLGMPYAPVRRMLDAGVAVALGTDFNPGTSPTYSMFAAVALACVGMKLTPAQAIVAATINAAHAVAAAEEVGSLEAGKAADLVITGAEDYRQLPMHFGVNPVETVVKRGRVVYRAGRVVREEEPS